MQCLYRGWPSVALETCAETESALRTWLERQWYEDASRVEAWTSYNTRIHYTAFLAIAIAHGAWMLNPWPSETAYRAHKRVAAWIEIVAYLGVGGIAAPCVVMLTFPGPSALHNRSALQFMTVCLLFAIKGFTQLVARVTRVKYVASFQYTHLLLIALLLFNLDEGASFHVSQLYRFAASAYGLGLAFAFHQTMVAHEVRWMARASEAAEHACLFAAHAMLTAIGGERTVFLQWLIQVPDDATLPIWRVLIFDWLVAATHLALQLALLIYALTDRRTRWRAPRKWRQHVATISTVAKLVVATALLISMLLFLTVDTTRVVPNWRLLRNCTM